MTAQTGVARQAGEVAPAACTRTLRTRRIGRCAAPLSSDEACHASERNECCAEGDPAALAAVRVKQHDEVR
jgi:hypothetical protein